jgi:hypothetical protein
VFGAGDQGEAGVRDAGGHGAHIAGGDEPVVITGQQQRRAADGAELPGKVAAARVTAARRGWSVWQPLSTMRADQAILWLGRM